MSEPLFATVIVLALGLAVATLVIGAQAAAQDTLLEYVVGACEADLPRGDRRHSRRMTG